jgi:hypothetical protein
MGSTPTADSQFFSVPLIYVSAWLSPLHSHQEFKYDFFSHESFYLLIRYLKSSWNKMIHLNFKYGSVSTTYNVCPCQRHTLKHW